MKKKLKKNLTMLKKYFRLQSTQQKNNKLKNYFFLLDTILKSC